MMHKIMKPTKPDVSRIYVCVHDYLSGEIRVWFHKEDIRDGESEINVFYGNYDEEGTARLIGIVVQHPSRSKPYIHTFIRKSGSYWFGVLESMKDGAISEAAYIQFSFSGATGPDKSVMGPT